MMRKYLIVLGLVLLPFFFPAGGDAAPFTLSTVMNGARIDGRGAIDFSSPEQCHISFSYPREIGIGLKESASKVLRECIDGKRSLIHDGITFSHIRKSPHSMRIDFPQNTYMVLVLMPKKDIREASEGRLYNASFREKKRTFPFLLHVSDRQISMFSTSLLPIGWIETEEGRPGKITRVLPDPKADKHLEWLAEAFRAGGVSPYEGAGWLFECSSLEKP